MVDKHVQENAQHSNTEKDPKDWVTGDEPMTGAQRSYLSTLCEEAKLPFDDSLSKAQASQRIDELQKITGRGQSLPDDAGAAPRRAPAADDDPAAGGSGAEP